MMPPRACRDEETLPIRFHDLQARLPSDGLRRDDRDLDCTALAADAATDLPPARQIGSGQEEREI